MKMINKILFPVAMILCFVGCSSDNEPEVSLPASPELVIGEEVLMVKIGEENKAELKVLQGGGDYNAFSANENIAKVEIINEKIMIEGVGMGKTYIIVSDKNSYYVKQPVSVYFTDVLELDKTEVEAKSPVGRPVTITVEITKGNGGYRAVSDNDKISVSITQAGTITVTGQPDDAETETTATVTVTDNLDLTATLIVRIIPTTNPYTDVELEKILSDSSRRYYLDEKNQVNPDWSVNFRNTQENEKITYGWDYYYYNFLLTFTGDKTEGKKTDASLSCYNYVGWDFVTYENQAINLEIIKNDGTHIWGVYSFTKDGTLYRGYFCDTTNP